MSSNHESQTMKIKIKVLFLIIIINLILNFMLEQIISSSYKYCCN